MINKKLMIGGGALAALLLLGGNKKSKSSGSKDDELIDSEDLGDVDEPVGPKGCKPGLVEKEGFCKNEDSDSSDKSKNKGKIPKSNLVIFPDCTFAFGDGTGDSFWKEKGTKYAKQWVDYKYTDPLYIAYEMLKQWSPACYAKFPLKTEFEDYFEYEYSLREWINSYRDMWELMWILRNKIDLTFFGGETTVEASFNKKGTLDFKFGPNFNYDLFWDNIKTTASAILLMEQEKPGSSYIGAGKDISSSDVNTVDYIFTRIFPSLKLDKSKKTISNKHSQTDFYQWMVGDPLDSISGQSLDIDWPNV